MNVMKGKKYYVSIGYIDKKEHPNIDAKFIKSLIVQCKDGTVYHDEENGITIPIMPVNQIQKKEYNFEFRFLFQPFKARWVEDDDQKSKYIRYNIFGLFESTIEDGIENIRLINFYESSNTKFDFYNNMKVNTIIFNIYEKELTEEK